MMLQHLNEKCMHRNLYRLVIFVIIQCRLVFYISVFIIHSNQFASSTSHGCKPFQLRRTFLSETSKERTDADFPSTDSHQPECGAILPGQVISIRIGDMSQPKKAWKKRRRTGSPILVPCTILGMNRESMVKWNLMTLLHRFGKLDGENEHNGVVLTLGAAVNLYKSRLGGNLLVSYYLSYHHYLSPWFMLMFIISLKTLGSC